MAIFPALQKLTHIWPLLVAGCGRKNPEKNHIRICHSVLFSNHSQTIMLQLQQLSLSLTDTKNTLQLTSSLAYHRPASL